VPTNLLLHLRFLDGGHGAKSAFAHLQFDFRSAHQSRGVTPLR
jgi:hypothetical protein